MMLTLSTTKTAFTAVFLLVCLQYTFCDSNCGGNRHKYQLTDDDGQPYCRTCKKCPPGTGVSIPCDKTRNTECEICRAGSYSSRWSRTDTCRPCNGCPSHLVTLRNCTNTKNTKCARRCEQGYFFNNNTDECVKCSNCPLDSLGDSPGCIQQRLHGQLQCMPTRKVSSSQKLLKMIGYSGMANFDTVERDIPGPSEENSTDFRHSTTEQPEKVYKIPKEHYFTLPTILASIIVICVAVGIAVYCVLQRRRIYTLEGNYNVLDERALVRESRSDDSFQETGYLNPLEELERKGRRNLKYQALDEDVLWEVGQTPSTSTAT
ncbi:tumor necrosis factor receptor superfamily member 11A-like [Ptychodera flava]|uniref:tumor necrosis factor receptor superfamily member 11A-like n=1 Tax=Ptychodera flava TaxID=63121 RepID=UPI00396A067F